MAFCGPEILSLSSVVSTMNPSDPRVRVRLFENRWLAVRLKSNDLIPAFQLRQRMLLWSPLYKHDADPLLPFKRSETPGFHVCLGKSSFWQGRFWASSGAGQMPWEEYPEGAVPANPASLLSEGLLLPHIQSCKRPLPLAFRAPRGVLERTLCLNLDNPKLT